VPVNRRESPPGAESVISGAVAPAHHDIAMLDSGAAGHERTVFVAAAGVEPRSAAPVVVHETSGPSTRTTTATSA
jgi:hypothetical protein